MNVLRMAKWGEGDPRWIVEERQDSHNVNNWHWKEVGKLLYDSFCMNHEL